MTDFNAGAAAATSKVPGCRPGQAEEAGLVACTAVLHAADLGLRARSMRTPASGWPL
jgi:hypothetical protein